jgi:hypothetical protein
MRHEALPSDEAGLLLRLLIRAIAMHAVGPSSQARAMNLSTSRGIKIQAKCFVRIRRGARHPTQELRQLLSWHS